MSDRFAALTRRRLLGVGGAALLGSAAISTDRVRREMDLSVSIPDEAWPVRGRTPDRTSRTPGTGPTPQTATVWKRNVGGLKHGSGLVADERRLYALAEDGLLAVDREDGGVAWTYDGFRRDDVAVRPEGPVVLGRTHAFVPAAGDLHAISLVDGTLDWRRDRTGAGGLLPVGNVLFASAGDDVLALDGSTGAVHWRVPDSGATVPVCFDDGTLFCTGPSTTVAFDAASGAPTWHTVGGLGARTEYRGAVSDDHLFLVGDDGPPSVIALDRATGGEAWALQSPEGVWGLSVGDDRLYVTSGDPGTLLALSTADGSVRWRRSVRPVGRATPVLSTDVLYVRVANAVLGLDPGTGADRFTPIRIQSVSPLVVADGRLYLEDGQRLYALEGSA